MSSLHSLTTRFATALALVGSLSAVASADMVRVPHKAPPPSGHFAQPPSGISSAPIDRAEADPFVPSYDRATVRAMLAEARARNLAAFHAYATAGIYPSNVYKPGALNVWRDQDGHFCAAATIIRQSGEVALTDKVAEQTNFIRLADVSQGPLMDWMLTSGLTQEELVAIQKPFNPVVDNPVPVPEQPIAIDTKLRAGETARLQKVYAQVERQLAKNTKASLDTAVDRLMKHPALIDKLDEQSSRAKTDGARS